MFTHNLDPVLFEIGYVSIRWYSLAYIFGILIGWWYGKKILLNKFENSNAIINSQKFDDLITYLIISIVIGGRFGYALFYNLEYYIYNPIDVFKIWQGGMSFHGALIGVIVGTYLFSKKRNLNTFIFLDVIACVSPIGIFLGRIANFINGELVGKVSDLYFSVIFPKIDMNPRHPSQLYEAFLEGLILFLIMNFLIYRKNYKTGNCSFLFLFFYGIFRIISEFFREPDAQIGYFFNFLSMGSILSFFMMISGSIMFLYLKKRNEI